MNRMKFHVFCLSRPRRLIGQPQRNKPTRNPHSRLLIKATTRFRWILMCRINKIKVATSCQSMRRPWANCWNHRSIQTSKSLILWRKSRRESTISRSVPSISKETGQTTQTLSKTKWMSANTPWTWGVTTKWKANRSRCLFRGTK